MGRPKNQVLHGCPGARACDAVIGAGSGIMRRVPANATVEQVVPSAAAQTVVAAVAIEAVISPAPG